MQSGPEGLNLCVERLRGGIGGAVVEEVEYFRIVRVDSGGDGVECLVPEVRDVVEPSCQLRVGHSLVPRAVVDDPEPVHEPVCLRYVRVQPEEYRSPLPLGLRPFLRRLEQQVPAAEEQLLERVAVLQQGRHVFLPVQPGVLHPVGLLVYRVPAVAYPYLLEGVIGQLLHVEAVYHPDRVRKAPPGDEAHRARHVERYLGHRLAYGQRHAVDYGYYVLGLRAAYHRHKGSLAASRGLVGHYRVQLAVGHPRLVHAQAGTDVARIQYPLLGVSELVPRTVRTQVILVLTLEPVAVYSVVLLKRAGRYRVSVQEPLLKKTRTPWSDAFPRRQGHSCSTRCGPLYGLSSACA